MSDNRTTQLSDDFRHGLIIAIKNIHKPFPGHRRSLARPFINEELGHHERIIGTTQAQTDMRALCHGARYKLLRYGVWIVRDTNPVIPLDNTKVKPTQNVGPYD